MEHFPELIKFEIYENDICIHSGTVWTIMIPTLADAYINFPESNYKIKIMYNNSKFIVDPKLLKE